MLRGGGRAAKRGAITSLDEHQRASLSQLGESFPDTDRSRDRIRARSRQGSRH